MFSLTIMRIISLLILWVWVGWIGWVFLTFDFIKFYFAWLLFWFTLVLICCWLFWPILLFYFSSLVGASGVGPLFPLWIVPGAHRWFFVCTLVVVLYVLFSIRLFGCLGWFYWLFFIALVVIWGVLWPMLEMCYCYLLVLWVVWMFWSLNYSWSLLFCLTCLLVLMAMLGILTWNEVAGYLTHCSFIFMVGILLASVWDYVHSSFLYNHYGMGIDLLYLNWMCCWGAHNYV